MPSKVPKMRAQPPAPDSTRHTPITGTRSSFSCQRARAAGSRSERATHIPTAATPSNSTHQYSRANMPVFSTADDSQGRSSARLSRLANLGTTKVNIIITAPNPANTRMAG